MKFFIASIFLFFSLNLFAASPTFLNLTQSDYEKITREFSSNFAHHSVQGANTLGSIFGFEFGVLLGLTKSPDSDAIAKAGTPPGELSNLPHGGLFAAVSIPLGFTAEVVMIPKTSTSDSEFQTSSIALKWTSNNAFPVLPINLALRASVATSYFSFNQTVSGVATKVENKNSVNGLTLLLSPKLPIIEPYVGIGYLSGKNTLSGTVFTYSASSSADATATSTEYILGATARLLFFTFGAEYYTSFGTNGYTAKLGFGF